MSQRIPAPTRMLSTFADGMKVLNETLWMNGSSGVAIITQSLMPTGATRVAALESAIQTRRTPQTSARLFSQLVNLQGLRRGSSGDRVVGCHQMFHLLGRPRRG